MEAEKEKLIKGFIKNGLTEAKAQKLWLLIEPFAAYGFNKAHAASYGRVAYQTSYLKANFPAIYMSAVLSADSGDVEKIAETIAECKRMGIPILPPDINESFSQFTVIKGEIGKSSIIRFGLVTIKNFGQGIATAIIDERKQNGKFKSLVDFIDRVKDRNLNKKSLEALIKVGAMDSLGYDRGVLLGNTETLLAHNKERDKMPENQDSLFGLMTDTSTVPTLKLSDVPNAAPSEKLTWEKELLGLYISGHPLEKFQEAIAKQTINIAKIKEVAAVEPDKEMTEEEASAAELKKIEEKKAADKIAAQKKANAPKTFGAPAQRKPSEAPTIILAVIVDEIRQIMTKKNEPMLFIKVSDFTGTIEAVVFPRTYREFRTAFTPDACLAIKATVSDRNGEKSLIIEKVKKLS
jgi:DNA polymerase-3 subunit alpha